MTTPLRFGILGCARIVRRAVAMALRNAPHARLEAIASRDIALARSWADEFQIPTVHASYEALIADPAIDAVYIPLPNELHRPWVLVAAAAGKHVLCEKPLALDAAEARRDRRRLRPRTASGADGSLHVAPPGACGACPHDAGRWPVGRAAAGEDGFFA